MIHHLSTPWSHLPGGITVSGHPALNLSFALNYALGGGENRSSAIKCSTSHLRRGGPRAFRRGATLLRWQALAPLWGADATWLASLTAVLWAVSPLQTESVTYIVLRTESLAAGCVLLSLYGFVRSTESPVPRRWQALSVGATLLGAAIKESAMVAPLLLLLYDRTFIIDSYRAALRIRPDFPEAHYNLANVLVDLGRLDESVGRLRAAVTIEPGNVDAHFNLGNALWQSGHPADAARVYETVVRINPGDTDAACNLSTLRGSSGPGR